MDKITKIINFEIKQVGEDSERVLRFIGSDETPDRDNDIIRTDGWQYDEYMKNPVFLWAHDYKKPPIGKCINMQKDLQNKKLMFDIKFPTIAELSSDVENPAEHAKFVDMVYNMYKGGYLQATSVGYAGLEYKVRDDAESKGKPEKYRGKEFLKQNLYELSAVPVPANPNALQEAKSQGLIDDITIKSFSMSENKTADPEGNPSVYDIMREISTAVRNANMYYDFYIEDLFPTTYPSGSVVIETYVNRQYRCYLHDYTYAKANGAVTITLGAGMEMQEQYAVKSIKSLYGIETKAGASISAKNKAVIDECINHMSAATETLKSMIETTETEEEPETKATESEEIKSLKGLIENLTNEVAELKTKKPPEPPESTEGEINLDDIQLPTDENKAVKDELDLKPEQLAEMISKAITQNINALTGKI